ncbi:hypothetical protein IA57_11565 [Mangrovimonas yunxiaonensis]|uniref:Lipoprotein n=1 Tax=Mangrovimonas yunxiaonensis TaxID=1197477 RepID=A0A084THY4_9FLAO|nr:DUF6146 family protein [Mangrovimonas yunxiaonensis]KFB00320.1 hypothetical protein IA57_11565 [Mangrovimonas yunxiaonensis]GGH41701.1 hypothetical protein GCM10011364_12670 [Mangrovimonas yunxiaonensis]
MKSWCLALVIGLLVIGCNASKTASKSNDALTQVENDTVRISNANTAYEILIIEPGFNAWLISTARPEGYYSKTFLEHRNWIYATEWNQRVLQPLQYDNSLYEMPINYEKGVDYGYEVNYKLYNYFIYFQLKYKQQLAQFIPRI